MGVLARKRVGTVLGLVGACFLLLMVRVIYVQFIWAGELGSSFGYEDARHPHSTQAVLFMTAMAMSCF